MKIRATELKDLPRVMEIYDYARAFMRTNGNVTQWIGGYPHGQTAAACSEGYCHVPGRAHIKAGYR